LTDLIQNSKISAGMRRRLYTSFYTGSLIKSYIQFHLTPRWNPLKNSFKHLQNTAVLEPYKNYLHNAEKPYFSTPYTPRNPIKE